MVFLRRNINFYASDNKKYRNLENIETYFMRTKMQMTDTMNHLTKKFYI